MREPLPRDNDRIHHVAKWMIENDIPVAAFVRRELERIVETGVKDYALYNYNVCNETQAAINTYEPEVV